MTKDHSEFIRIPMDSLEHAIFKRWCDRLNSELETLRAIAFQAELLFDSKNNVVEVKMQIRKSLNTLRRLERKAKEGSARA